MGSNWVYVFVYVYQTHPGPIKTMTKNSDSKDRGTLYNLHFLRELRMFRKKKAGEVPAAPSHRNTGVFIWAKTMILASV